MPCNIQIHITIEEENNLQTILQTLQVEISEKSIKRASMKLEVKDMDLVISIFADDLVAARSLSNSILRLLKTSADVVNIIEEKAP